MQMRRTTVWKYLMVLQSFICLSESLTKAESQKEKKGLATKRLYSLCETVLRPLFRPEINEHSGFEPAQINFCLDELFSVKQPDTKCNSSTSNCNVSCLLTGHLQNYNKHCIESCECNSSGFFEGDIKFDERDLNIMHHVYLNTPIPDGDTAAIQIWDEYVIGGYIKIPFESTLGGKTDVLVYEAMSVIEHKTCLQFFHRTNEEDFLEFHQGVPLGCWSHIGRQGGRQLISIGRGCETQRTILHEIMHALGFWHEHTRSDRDEHVKVVYKNIDKLNGKEQHFLKRMQIEFPGLPYDYESVTQFGGFAYSTNNKPTLLDKRTNQPLKVEINTLSKGDVARINKRYGCAKLKTPAVTILNKSEL